MAPGTGRWLGGKAIVGIASGSTAEGLCLEAVICTRAWRRDYGRLSWSVGGLGGGEGVDQFDVEGLDGA